MEYQEEQTDKDGVIRRNLARTWDLAATPLPSKPSRHSKVNLTKTICKIHPSIDKEKERKRDVKQKQREMEDRRKKVETAETSEEGN